MRMIAFPVASGGGRLVHVNPAHVVCLMEAGERRTQIVTTGLSGETSISLIVDGAVDDVAARLEAGA